MDAWAWWLIAPTVSGLIAALTLDPVLARLGATLCFVIAAAAALAPVRPAASARLEPATTAR